MGNVVSVRATRTIYKHASDSQELALVFSEALYGRTISAVAAISAAAGLTVASESVNASAFNDDNTGEEIPVSEAVLYTCSGGTAGNSYDVTITVTLSDGSTLVGIQAVSVVTS